MYFKKGYYVYVGSGMNSLIGRLKRHLSSDKKKHWHIDYFLCSKHTKIKEILFNVSEKKIECDLAKEINGLEIDKFGASDCRCNSHLFYFENFETCVNNVGLSFKKLNVSYNNLNDFYNLIYWNSNILC
ncbi:MAG: DUF123 domain-containing protein [Methanobrevibacter sp.]|nr:DUF123 domain-containing protein [Candidatus Methanovirga procula]